MLDLFQWFYLQKIEGRNPFWRLLELIAESNDYENVNNAQVDEVPDVEGAVVGGDDVEIIKVWRNFHFSFFYNFMFGTEKVICPKNSEGWMVGVWEGLSLDRSKLS